MALRKAAALGRRLGYLSHSEEQGGAGWLGGVTGEKLIYGESRLLKRLSRNWLSSQPCQAEDRPTDVEGPASGPTH